MAKGIIPIADARRLANRRGVPVVIIYAIHPGGQEFTVTTYGATKKLCRHAADLGRKIAKAVLGREVRAAEIEPLDVPDSPAVMRPTE